MDILDGAMGLRKRTMVPPPMTRTAGVHQHRRRSPRSDGPWAARAPVARRSETSGTDRECVARGMPARVPGGRRLPGGYTPGVECRSEALPLRTHGSPTSRAAALPRLVALLVAVLGLAAAATVVPGGPVAAGSPSIIGTAVTGSPFRGSGSRSRVALQITLATPARLTVSAVDYGGHLLRRLLDEHEPAGGLSVVWDGRDPRGHPVPDGPYRLRATATTPDGRVTVDRWVTKAPGAPYPRLPGAIVVAINPGHGGSDTGAVAFGTREKDLNLDIALRLRRMLQAAGITVVMTRSRDVDVNRPALDRNGDGHISHLDELIARNDIADLARADLTINIHNNATACHCGQGTEVFVSRKRPWSSESLHLGRAVLDRIVRRLRPFQAGGWMVHDRGIGPGDYFALRPATKRARRPTLMPAILGESLFVDSRPELRRLRDPRVRTAIAAGYYDGITAWLAARRFGVRYSHIDVPDRVPAGAEALVHLRIANTGNTGSASWRLEARVVHRVPVLDGSGTRGRLVGSMAIPNGLGPGGVTDLDLDITMPSERRQWLLKLDIVGPAGRLSDAGVVQPQSVVTTTAPSP